MNYLVAKITPTDVTVIINGNHKRIRKESPDSLEVIELVKLHNASSVAEERENIIAKIEELCNPAKKIQFKSDGRFEFDGNSAMYLVGTSDPIPEFLAKKHFLAYKAVKVARKYDKETGEEIISVSYDENTGERVEEMLNQSMVFRPYHSGSHGMVVKVGEPISMPREECDSDPYITCSAGLRPRFWV